jgi:hypothetical protein
MQTNFQITEAKATYLETCFFNVVDFDLRAGLIFRPDLIAKTQALINWL